MHLTKQSAIEVLQDECPAIKKSIISNFVNWAYGTSQEMDIGNLLLKFFDYWYWNSKAY